MSKRILMLLGVLVFISFLSISTYASSDRITISGTVEGEFRYQSKRDISDKDSDFTSDLYGRAVEFGIEGKVTDWITANVVLLSEWIGDSVNAGDEQLTIDEAAIYFEKAGYPFYAVIGKRVQPTGVFKNHLNTDPLTQDAYETKRVGLTLGYRGPLGIDISATVYKGEEMMTHLFESGLFETDNTQPSFFARQEAPAGDDVGSYILSASISPLSELLTLYGSYTSEPGTGRRNNTLSLAVNSQLLNRLTVDVEYIMSLKREDYTGYNRQFKEKVMSITAAIQVTDPVEVAIRYERFDDDGMYDFSNTWSVNDRYSVGGTYTFYNDEDRGLTAYLGVEYRRTDYRLDSAQTGRAKHNDEFYTKLGVGF